MNVQSLDSHSGDVETDSVIQRCDYLALSETLLREDQETMHIRDFECVTRRLAHRQLRTPPEV
jgi:hypothetical protein